MESRMKRKIKPVFWVLAIVVVVCVVVGIGILINPIDKASFGESYVRISWDEEGEEEFWYLIGKDECKNAYPAIRIDTAEEMGAFIQQLDEYFYLTRGEDSFEKAMEVYDNGFYDTHSLVIAYIPENSGSIRHRISSLKEDEQTISIEIEQIHPDICSADMAGWFMLYEMEDEKVDGRELVVYQKGKTPEVQVEKSTQSLVVTDEYTDCPNVDIRMLEFMFGDGMPYLELEFQNYSGKTLAVGEDYHLYREVSGQRQDCSKEEMIWESILYHMTGLNPMRQMNLWGQDISKEGHYVLEFEFSFAEEEETYTASIEFDIVHNTYDTEFIAGTGFDSIDFKGEVGAIGDTYIFVMPFEGEAVDKRKIRVDVEHLEDYEELLTGMSVGDKVRVFYNPNSADANGTRVKADKIYQAGKSLYYWERTRVAWNEEDEDKFWVDADNKIKAFAEDASHLPIREIESWEEWQAFQTEFTTMLQESTVGKFGIYDEIFFEEYDLLLFYVATGSGSVEYNVESVDESVYHVNILVSEYVPEDCTCDMAAWLFTAAVEKGALIEDADFDVVLDYEDRKE